MRTMLIALTAAAGFAFAGLAIAPAAAAPLAPPQLAFHKAGNKVEQVRHVFRDHRRHRHVHRHFWNPGPWAYGRSSYQNCVRVGHGVFCYY